MILSHNVCVCAHFEVNICATVKHLFNFPCAINNNAYMIHLSLYAHTTSPAFYRFNLAGQSVGCMYEGWIISTFSTNYLLLCNCSLTSNINDRMIKAEPTHQNFGAHRCLPFVLCRRYVVNKL